MNAIVRRYGRPGDYEAVGELLVRTYGAGGGHVNWLQPRWEYMHYHPLIRGIDLGAIGVWEASGRTVGVAHPEHHVGITYLQLDPGHRALGPEMLAYAETHLSSGAEGVRRLYVHIHDTDDELQRVASEAGYMRSDRGEPMSALPLAPGLPPAPLPEGFRLRSLADDNDLRKVDRALWRGFDHPGEPPAEGIRDRAFMQSAPGFRKDLNLVVEAPGGDFVSYCGMWLEPRHSVAYVEPVATDPDFRGRGLARAAVLEGVRRCERLGATKAFVGSGDPFYGSLGFRLASRSSAWRKEWRAKRDA